MFLISVGITQSEAATYSCKFESGDYFYSCKFQNVEYRDKADVFEINSIDHMADDSDVLEVMAIESVFHFVPMQIFEKFRDVIVLNMENVQLQELDQPFVNCEKLDRIDFTSNELQFLPKVFDQCKSLAYLHLNNNNIRAVEEDAFTELAGFQWLELSDNQLESIPDKLFASNEKLSYLDLSYQHRLNILVGSVEKVGPAPNGANRQKVEPILY